MAPMTHGPHFFTASPELPEFPGSLPDVAAFCVFSRVFIGACGLRVCTCVTPVREIGLEIGLETG